MVGGEFPFRFSALLELVGQPDYHGAHPLGATPTCWSRRHEHKPPMDAYIASPLGP